MKVQSAGFAELLAIRGELINSVSGVPDFASPVAQPRQGAAVGEVVQLAHPDTQARGGLLSGEQLSSRHRSTHYQVLPVRERPSERDVRLARPPHAGLASFAP